MACITLILKPVKDNRNKGKSQNNITYELIYELRCPNSKEVCIYFKKVISCDPIRFMSANKQWFNIRKI